MPFGRWQAHITDPQGNVVLDAEITVRQETVGAPLALLKADKDGLTNKGNPFIVQPGDNGLAWFYVAAGFYKIEARKGGNLIAEPFRDVAIGTAAGSDSSAFGTAADTDDALTGADAFLHANAGGL